MLEMQVEIISIDVSHENGKESDDGGEVKDQYQSMAKLPPPRFWSYQHLPQSTYERQLLVWLETGMLGSVRHHLGRDQEDRDLLGMDISNP